MFNFILGVTLCFLFVMWLNRFVVKLMYKNNRDVTLNFLKARREFKESLKDYIKKV